MRQIILDTETTGLSAQHGHRLTEIGLLELIDRKLTGRTFQTYLNPERELDAKAAEITGLSWAMLKDKPKFTHIADEFINFIDGAELVIHNAPFDLGFLDHELGLINHPWGKITGKLSVIDTLILSRDIHPGQRNSLDALCKRYNIDNSHRTKHGALLDAEILAHVYLAMTAGQTSLDLMSKPVLTKSTQDNFPTALKQDPVTDLKIIYANEQEQADHLAMMAMIQKKKK